MDVKFLEATNGFNWGKFMIARYTVAELAEPARCPGCEQISRRLVSLRGPAHHHIWILDLATGEGARFDTDLRRPWDINKAVNEHRIQVCLLYIPMLIWLMAHIDKTLDAWWESLPRVIDLPEAEPGLFRPRNAGKFEGPDPYLAIPHAS